MRLLNAIAMLFFLEQQASTVAAQGCLGGVPGVTYLSDDDKCNCYSTACTQETCEDQMGGVWTTDCPTCDPAECDPLAVETEGYDSNPSCTGPAALIDRFGKKMYRRKVMWREIPDIPLEGGVYCHIGLQLCDDETQISHGIDSGFGDWYRLAAAPEWQDWKGTAEYAYSGMHKPTSGRAYSPVNPLNEHMVQLTIKEYIGRGSDYECTNGVDCQYGLSELACHIPIGSDMLLSKRPDHDYKGGPHNTWNILTPNFSREPGSGPYTINLIGQGVALTELNINTISEMMEPYSSDGSFSAIKEINYLWANSYWSSSKWMWGKTNSTDLSRVMTQKMAKYGIRFNLMHSISREIRPEAEWPRADTQVYGEAFKLTNTTNQDPNIKWFVVGSGNYKKAVYPQIAEWGFDIQICNERAVDKGHPWCGPNALYDQLPHGVDPFTRERSALFQYYEGLEAAR